jgi:hypothetical protein
MQMISSSATPMAMWKSQNLWDPSLYFTVNIAFGRFAFSTVKVIDAG